MALARSTLKYGNVYFRAICCKTIFSCELRIIINGLFLGISHLLFEETISYKELVRQSKYVIVFMNTCTKSVISNTDLRVRDL